MELLKTAEKRGKEFVNKNKEKNSGSLADKTSKTYYKEFKKVRSLIFYLCKICHLFPSILSCNYLCIKDPYLLLV